MRREQGDAELAALLAELRRLEAISGEDAAWLKAAGFDVAAEVRILHRQVLLHTVRPARARKRRRRAKRAGLVLLAVLVAVLGATVAMGHQDVIVKSLYRTTNCMPTPHFCNFPDATNTGYGSTTLTPYTGSTNINVAGTTITGADIHGPVQVSAANVTITNSRIYVTDTTGQNVGLWIRGGGTNFTASNVEITGNLTGQSYCISALANDSTGANFDRINAHDCGDGIRGGNMTMTNSYFHDFWFGKINGVNIDTPHADCWQGLNGQSNTDIEHNTCNNGNSLPPPGSPGYSNSVLQLGTEGGFPACCWVFNNNLVQGGGLSVNMRQTPITNITITNNHWGRDYGNGLIGSNTGNTYSWSGNVWDDDGTTALPLPG